MPLAPGYKNPFGRDVLGAPKNRGVRLPTGEMIDLQEDNQTMMPPRQEVRPPQEPNYKGYYGDLFNRGVENYDQNRVTPEDIEANRNSELIRNALAGFSKAAAGVGGTQTVVPDVVKGLNEADKQALGARDALAGQAFEQQQMGLQGLQNEDFRPLKLESAQLGLESSRRNNEMQIQASDAQSPLSQNIRKFYKERIGISFPENISAADIEGYVKDPALKKMAYENEWKRVQAGQAFSRQQAEENRQFRMEERERDRQTMLENARLRNESNLNQNAKAYNALPEPQKIAVKELSTSAAKKQVITNQIEGFLKQWKSSSTNAEKTRVGQQMIKLLNSTEGQDAVGAEEARRLANELEPYTWKSPTGLPRLGQDLEGFENRIEAVRSSLRNAVETNQKQVMDIYQEYAPETLQQTRTEPQVTPAGGRRVWSPNQQAGK